MNAKQRKQLQYIRKHSIKLYGHDKIREECIYTFNFGHTICYEVMIGSKRLLSQHVYLYEIGPKGGLRNVTKVY